MKKLLNIFIVFLFSFVFFGGNGEVFAITYCEDATTVHNPDTYVKDTYVKDNPDNSFSISLSNLTVSASYTLEEICITSPPFGGAGTSYTQATINQSSNSDGNLVFSSTPEFFGGEKYCHLRLSGPDTDCKFRKDFIIESDNYQCTNLSVWQWKDGVEGGEKCTYTNNNCVSTGHKIYIDSDIIMESGKPIPTDETFLHDLNIGLFELPTIKTSTNTFSSNLTINNTGPYNLTIKKNNFWTTEICKIDNAFKVLGTCPCTKTGEDDPDDTIDTYKSDQPFSLCKQIPDGPLFAEQRAACYTCTGGDETKENNQGVWTAIGCINRDPQSIMQSLISVGLGMSGGVALLTFLAAGFIFSTSQGDPKAYGKAKEMMTASVVGIIFVIFSVTLLQFIGYEIFKIPGFGG